MADTDRPMTFGLAHNIVPFEVDVTRNVYQVHEYPIERVPSAVAIERLREWLEGHNPPVIPWQCRAHNEDSSFIDINCIAYDGIASNTQVDNGEPAYGDVGGKPFDQVMAEWDALIKEVKESE